MKKLCNVLLLFSHASNILGHQSVYHFLKAVDSQSVITMPVFACPGIIMKKTEAPLSGEYDCINVFLI